MICIGNDSSLVSAGIVSFTTVKQPDQLPVDLLADEKHTRLNGEKAFVATTVGDDCVLGASVAQQADEKDLTEA